jgi:hypothetical protein
MSEVLGSFRSESSKSKNIDKFQTKWRLKMENEDIAKIDLPASFKLQECSIRRGIISFLCPKCKQEFTLQSKSFKSERAEKENAIIATRTNG